MPSATLASTRSYRARVRESRASTSERSVPPPSLPSTPTTPSPPSRPDRSGPPACRTRIGSPREVADRRLALARTCRRTATGAEAASGVRGNGGTAAGWLPVEGRSEPQEPGELTHRDVEVPVGVRDRAGEVPEELEADGSVERAPGEQRAHPDGVVDGGVLPAEDGRRLDAHQLRVPVAPGGLRQGAAAGRVTEDPAQNHAHPRGCRDGVARSRVAGHG